MRNHRTIRGLKPKLDWVSYHQYATSCKSSDPKYYQQCFFTDAESGADMFIEEVRRHNEIQDHLAPHVKTTVDEIWTMLPVLCMRVECRRQNWNNCKMEYCTVIGKSPSKYCLVCTLYYSHVHLQ